MNQTQNISDERLAEKLRYAEIAEAAYVKSGLNPEAELWGEDVSLLRELTALRASHKRLVEALEFHDKLMRRLWKEVNFFNFALSAETIQMLNLSESMARATLAEASKLEGK